MNPMEQPVPSERKASGLEQKLAEYQAELDEIEVKIERVRQLQTIASGFETSRALLVNFEGGEDAVKSVEASIAAIQVLEEKQGLTELLERRRKLKQLMATGKMDLGGGESEQE